MSVQTVGISLIVGLVADWVVGMADDAAAGVVRQAAQKSPAMSRPVQKYGEGAVLNLARNAAHTSLLSEVGEESAEALLLHGDVAMNILRVCPDSSAANWSLVNIYNLQSTIYNLQSVELGGLSPADMRSLFHRYWPRFQARAAAYAELCYLCATRRGTLKFVNRNSSLVLLQIVLFLIVPTCPINIIEIIIYTCYNTNRNINPRFITSS